MYVIPAYGYKFHAFNTRIWSVCVCVYLYIGTGSQWGDDFVQRAAHTYDQLMMWCFQVAFSIKTVASSNEGKKHKIFLDFLLHPFNHFYTIHAFVSDKLWKMPKLNGDKMEWIQSTMEKITVVRSESAQTTRRSIHWALGWSKWENLSKESLARIWSNAWT